MGGTRGSKLLGLPANEGGWIAVRTFGAGRLCPSDPLCDGYRVRECWSFKYIGQESSSKF